MYLLVRSKKQTSAARRVQDLLRSTLFNQVRSSSAAAATTPSPFSKVHAVEGDLRHPNLGLSDQDLQVLKSKVHIVLHCAADIRVEPSAQESLRCAPFNFGWYGLARPLLVAVVLCSHTHVYMQSSVVQHCDI